MSFLVCLYALQESFFFFFFKKSVSEKKKSVKHPKIL